MQFDASFRAEFNLSRSVQELQLEKVQLELENKEMEKKLKQLQSNMSREKQERG